MKKILAILAVLCAALAVTSVIGFSQASTAKSEVIALQGTVDQLKGDNERISTELTEATAQVVEVKGELDAQTKMVTDYFGMSKEIRTDLDSLKGIYQRFAGKHTDKQVVSESLADFELGFIELKNDGDAWKALLESNKATFTEMGIDTSKDIGDMQVTLPLVEKSLTQIRDSAKAL